MAPLATVAELGVYTGAGVDSGDQARAMMALTYATKVVRSYCGWNITQETVTGASVDGTGRRDVWLPTLYLTAVAEVVDATTATTLTFDTDYTWTSDGRLHRPSGWAKVPRLLTVTYTHGYADTPEDVKGAVLAVASRRFENPQQHRMERIDDYSVTTAGGSAHGLTEGEHVALADYRIIPL